MCEPPYSPISLSTERSMSDHLSPPITSLHNPCMFRRSYTRSRISRRKSAIWGQRSIARSLGRRSVEDSFAQGYLFVAIEKGEDLAECFQTGTSIFRKKRKIIFVVLRSQCMAHSVTSRILLVGSECRLPANGEPASGHLLSSLKVFVS